jgi:hypothetical protein
VYFIPDQFELFNSHHTTIGSIPFVVVWNRFAVTLKTDGEIGK